MEGRAERRCPLEECLRWQSAQELLPCLGYARGLQQCTSKLPREASTHVLGYSCKHRAARWSNVLSGRGEPCAGQMQGASRVCLTQTAASALELAS
eukprot:1157909-Pelagomonas_calceolata.AAC.14